MNQRSTLTLERAIRDAGYATMDSVRQALIGDAYRAIRMPERDVGRELRLGYMKMLSRQASHDVNKSAGP